MMPFRTLIAIALLCTATACSELAKLPVSAGIGPTPTLPSPNATLIPTVNIALAKGRPAGTLPRAAHGIQVNAFARDLDHPRWLYVLPSGDVLVGDNLYIANTDAVVRFPYAAGETQIRAAATTFVALPAGPINHH